MPCQQLGRVKLAEAKSRNGLASFNCPRKSNAPKKSNADERRSSFDLRSPASLSGQLLFKRLPAVIQTASSRDLNGFHRDNGYRLDSD